MQQLLMVSLLECLVEGKVACGFLHNVEMDASHSISDVWQLRGFEALIHNSCSRGSWLCRRK